MLLAIGVTALPGCAQAPKRGPADLPAAAERGLVSRADFASGSDRLSPRALQAAASNARWLRQRPHAVLLLAGHADERGSDAFNLELGDRRARACAAAMLRQGAAAPQLIIISRGEREPLDLRHTPAAWGMNRRVEFSIR